MPKKQTDSSPMKKLLKKMGWDFVRKNPKWTIQNAWESANDAGLRDKALKTLGLGALAVGALALSIVGAGTIAAAAIATELTAGLALTILGAEVSAGAVMGGSAVALGGGVVSGYLSKKTWETEAKPKLDDFTTHLLNRVLQKTSAPTMDAWRKNLEKRKAALAAKKAGKTAPDGNNPNAPANAPVGTPKATQTPPTSSVKTKERGMLSGLLKRLGGKPDTTTAQTPKPPAAGTPPAAARPKS